MTPGLSARLSLIHERVVSNPRAIARILVATLVCGNLMISATGCSSNSRKERHLNRADGFFEKADYQAAAIEYMNVLRQDRTHAEAIRQLGLCYFSTGNFRQAVPFLMRTIELDPTDSDIRLKMGALFLAAKRTEDAREQAAAVLEQDGTNILAVLLLADSSFTSNDVADAIETVLQVKERVTEDPMVWVALGNLRFRTRDFAGAEEAFRAAVTADPDRAAAHLALARLLRLTGQREEARSEFQLAVENAGLASKSGTEWVEFLIEGGEIEEAKALLGKTTDENPEFLPAWCRLARVALIEGDQEACASHIQRVLTQAPNNIEALLVKSDLDLTRGNTDSAIEQYQNLVASRPNAPLLRHRLAMSLLRNREVGRAIAELEKVTEQTPNHLQSRLQLAELYMGTGDLERAQEVLRELVDYAPGLARAHTLLGAVQKSRGDLSAALQSYARVMELTPDNPQGHYLTGRALLAQEKKPEAREKFETALEKSGTFSPALANLVMMDFQAGETNAALSRVNAQLATHPDEAPFHYLKAKVHLLAGETDEMEAALLETIRLDPKLLGAYILLSRSYASTGRLDESLERVKAALEVKPDDPGTLMLAGALYQQQGNAEEACKAYERVLATYATFAPAANNLAYLRSEQGRLDEAYALAERARTAAPDDPFVADTLGWILHQRGDHRWAISVLEESADKAPEQPEIHYHLGMARAWSGRDEAARESFQTALNLSTNFPGITRTRAALELLSSQLGGTDAELDAAIGHLRDLRESDPDNALVLSRLGAQLEARGLTSDAAAMYEELLQLNPDHGPGSLHLAALYAEDPDKEERAFELAEHARELTPGNKAVDGLLGWLAFRRGDYTWARSLLEAAVTRATPNPDDLYRLGLVAYVQGDTAIAKAHIQKAREVAATDEARQRAELLLSMLSIAEEADQHETVPETVRQALSADPQYLPALVVVAVIAETHGRQDEARKAYEKVLEFYPTYAPAAVALAALYVGIPDMQEKALSLATSARVSLPKDAGLAKTLGILQLTRDTAYAEQLLTEATKALPDDSEAFFYLGKVQTKLAKTEAARISLQRSIDLAPDSLHAKEAQSLLDSLK